ncbi:MAG: hypothetical protein SFU83_06770 [Meiothermus sp.]|nr:hypothetical protein [Meiothermus sp.]
MKTPQAVSLELAHLVLGADAAVRSGSGPEVLDAEGLVPVHWSGLVAEPMDLGETRVRLLRLAETASSLTDPLARDWLSEQALSVANLLRWITDSSVTYEEGVSGCLRVDPRPLPPDWMQAAREARDRALQDAGLPTGRAGYEAYAELDGVPSGEVSTVLQAWIDELQRRTRDQLPSLELPADAIAVKAVSGVPFSAYCDYPGRQIWINTDLPYTRAALKHLAAHEAYPGHYAHMGHRAASFARGAMLPDSALVITDSASSVLFEGIAERGLDLLEFRTERFDRVAWAQHRLQWACTLEVAHGLGTRRTTPAEAAQYLREVCFASEARIEGKLRFATHRLRSIFVSAYWWGGTVVGAWWNRVGAADRPQGIAHLYNHMHSPSTLRAHWQTMPKD